MSEVATRDVQVHDDAMGVDRLIFAGQPVPPDLLDAYRAATGDAGQADVEDRSAKARRAPARDKALREPTTDK